MILDLHCFNVLLLVMAVLALVVFVALNFIEAGYGKMISPKWGPAINNKLAWFLMECPVFLVLLYFWASSDRQWDLVPLIFFIFFEIHYFQRSFIFPLLLKGKSKMPLSIMAMGMVFNTINGYMQGEWIFFLSPDDMYTTSWLMTPQFVIGTIVFFAGMFVNISSDHIVRHLRKPGDNNHYLPQKGMYKYVTSANYFGEIVEWLGFAILTWSLSGLLFAIWTMANLVPRAKSIYNRYRVEFASQFEEKQLKRVFPFIY